MRLLAVLVIVLAAGLLPAVLSTPVYACTLPANFDAVEASNLIVEGRVLGWDDAGDARITYQIVVTRVFKGSATPGERLTVSDFGSRRQGEWEPTGGLCGTFPEDPTGKHLVIGLQGDSGELRSTNQTRFYLGDEPEGPGYEAAIARVGDGTPVPPAGDDATVTPPPGEETNTPAPPSAGNGDGGGFGRGTLLLTLAASLMLIAATGAFFAIRRRPTSG